MNDQIPLDSGACTTSKRASDLNENEYVMIKVCVVERYFSKSLRSILSCTHANDAFYLHYMILNDAKAHATDAP